MRRAAGQIKSAQVRGAIAGLERAEKPPVAGQSINRAVQDMIAVVDVLRCERPLENDALLDVRHVAGALEFFKDDFAIGRQHFLPIVMRPQIRRVHQDVKRLAAGGRGAGFGASGRREITGRVGRGFALLVDEIKLLVGVAAEHEIVMRQMLIALVQTQIQHDAGTGGFVFAALLELRADAAVDEFAVRANRIAVGDDGPEGDFLALHSCERP